MKDASRTIFIWNQVANVDGYRIYRKIGGGGYAQEASLSGQDWTTTSTYYYGTNQCFVVRSYRGNVESLDSQPYCTPSTPYPNVLVDFRLPITGIGRGWDGARTIYGAPYKLDTVSPGTFFAGGRWFGELGARIWEIARGRVRFDTTGLETKVIDKATLALSYGGALAVSDSSCGYEVSIANADSFSFWTYWGDDYGQFTAFGYALHEIDVTSAVIDWAKGWRANYGVIVRGLVERDSAPAYACFGQWRPSIAGWYFRADEP